MHVCSSRRMFCQRLCRASVVMNASPKSCMFWAAISAQTDSTSLGVAGRMEYFFIGVLLESISYNGKFQTGLCKLIRAHRRFHIRAFPDLAGILPTHVSKGGQDATGKTIQ